MATLMSWRLIRSVTVRSYQRQRLRTALGVCYIRLNPSFHCDWCLFIFSTYSYLRPTFIIRIWEVYRFYDISQSNKRTGPRKESNMAALSAISEGTLVDSPLPSSSSSSAASSLSTSSNSGDFDSCEGYLVVTFSRNNKAPPATCLNGDAGVENSEATAKTCPTVSATSSPKVGTRISRLAAMAAGVDVSQLQHYSTSTTPSVTSASNITTSCSTSPPSSCDYVRRFTYPDGDTHYDWLSCPLADMQAKGSLANSTTTHSLYSPKPISLATVPRKSFLVYDSSLPSASVPASSCYRRQLTTSRKMLRCEECGKYYGNEYSLHHHICLRRKDVWKKGDVPTQLVDGQLTYFCPVCSKPFKWLGNLTRHYYVHTGQRFFKCDICHKEFFSAYQVRRHMNSHTGWNRLYFGFFWYICELYQIASSRWIPDPTLSIFQWMKRLISLKIVVLRKPLLS
ncbi:hypothetical protein TcWFU_001687 [Taenia crassiceps]|uniref:C2H2-type domain-containing protein n=1 Tax=Taenia crassiceps TaxID=6207 RepID=A0ABR4QJV9_9CEST